MNALRIGSVTITASSESHAGSASVTVIPVPVATVLVTLAASTLSVGSSTQATASIKDASGSLVTDRIPTWSTDNSSVATVNATGVVTAFGAGTANIIATSEGKTGSAPLTVTQAPVASVTVTLASSTIIAGSTTSATATVKDANGNVLTGRAIDWLSDHNSVATVNATGTVTGLAAGTANIRATCEGQTGSASITVIAPTVASVSVSLAATTLAVGSRTQASATPKDGQGNPLTGHAITWSSDNTSIATVTAQGVVTAVSVGNANIIATSDGVPGSATLSVAVSAGYGSTAQKIVIVDIGASFSPTITGANTGSARFASRATSVATVSSQGVITGVGEGQTWIAATAAGFAPDSVYVIVTRNSTGPVLRTDLTNYVVTAGSTVTINIILDTRSTPIGGSEFSVGYTTSPNVFNNPSVAPTGTPAPVVSITQRGVFRASLASGTPLSGQLSVLQFTFSAPITSGVELLANRSGYLILTFLDIVSPTGSDLLPVSTSTRIPIIIQ